MIESLRKNKKGIFLMILSSFCVCLGQLFWKLSINHNLFYLLLGFGLYGFGALLMLYAYKFGKLSVLQPILSVNYIFTILFACLILHETILWQDIVGIFIIMIGVFLIGGGDND